MNARKSRGLQIAKTEKILEGIDGWVVPSQSSNKNILWEKTKKKHAVVQTVKKEE